MKRVKAIRKGATHGGSAETSPYSPLPIEKQVVIIYAGAKGFLDSVSVKKSWILKSNCTLSWKQNTLKF
ncbi:hypothetical protein ACMAV8_06225 [Helicobacter pylori]